MKFRNRAGFPSGTGPDFELCLRHAGVRDLPSWHTLLDRKACEACLSQPADSSRSLGHE